MRLYTNKVTGAEIRTDCVINGGDWVEVPTPPAVVTEEPQKEPKKRTTTTRRTKK